MDHNRLLHDIQEQFVALDKFLQTIDGRLGNIDFRLQRINGRLTETQLQPSTQEMIKINLLQNNGDLNTVKQEVKKIRDYFPIVEHDLECLLKLNNKKNGSPV
ncbi:hypothetical protein BEP19_08700 [Ammoniphilus oxalaticus]|uniref:Uncharacterized protein n=1 Tax=Ammoniphilus oxalaticus TaxID=66863 RepID=A0A419SKK0_9BACL|nr:hypothetical protein [Ammoniphilus oxalaticus]RKD24456.1 hypothetical protein BEP19_08700 [Ammoniphilus oxalaticus]